MRNLQLLFAHIFASSLWFCSSTNLDEITFRSSYAQSYFREERILQIKPAVILANMTLNRCLASCITKVGCQAFNFGQGECQLLNEHVCSEEDRFLTPMPGYAYYDIMEFAEQEENGPLWSTSYCREEGRCSRRCEAVVPMRFLNQRCAKDVECQVRTNGSLCRNGVCKCEDGFWISGETSCTEVPFKGYKRFQTRYISTGTERIYQPDAKHKCTEIGGTLVKVPDEETHLFLVSQMKQYGLQAAWIGLHDMDEKRSWGWQDMSPLVDPTFWAPDEPNNLANVEYCTEMKQKLDYLWNDVPCDLRKSYICQFHGEN